MAVINASDAVLVTLAVYRLATDLAIEDGPWSVFSRWRAHAVRLFGADSWIARGVHCPVCLSLWLTPVLLIVQPMVPWLVVWLAIAGAAGLLSRHMP